MATKKRAVRPSRAKAAASQAAAKGHKARTKAPSAPKGAVSRLRAAKPATRPAKRPTRGDEVIDLLRRPGGATVEEMVGLSGVKPHTLRATISVETRKRGLTVEMPGRAHYRIVS